MMMPPEEIQRLNATLAKVGVEIRRNELRALVARFEDHVARVGPSPGFERAIADAQAKLAALGHQEQPERGSGDVPAIVNALAETKAKLSELEQQYLAATRA